MKYNIKLLFVTNRGSEHVRRKINFEISIEFEEEDVIRYAKEQIMNWFGLIKRCRTGRVIKVINKIEPGEIEEYRKAKVE